MTFRSKRLPPDFHVTEEHRDWAIIKGYPMFLPDVILPDFREYWTSPNARNPAKKDWDRAFQTWMRAASPAGDKYNPGYWERCCHKANEMESRQSQRMTETFMERDRAGYAEKVTKPVPMPESVRAIVERMRKG